MGDGSGSIVFADWCSSADNDPRIGEDPAVGQYLEAYCVLYGTFEERKASRIPYIWVDSELSLIRGHIQGFPKKLGDIYMTRPVELGRGGGAQGNRVPFCCTCLPAWTTPDHTERDARRNGREILSAVGGETAAPHPSFPVDYRQ